MNTATAHRTELIVETPRGPSVAGTRITVYDVMDYIKDNCSREYTLQFLHITPAELDAAYVYIERHKDAVEQEYERILLREEAARQESERIYRERSPYPPDMPWEEKSKLLKEKLAAMKAAQAHHGSNHSA